MSLTAEAAGGVRASQAGATLHSLFEDQVARQPHAVAVRQHGRELSYRDLDDRATAIAGRLNRLGVGAGDIVAVAVDRSPELVAALLGVLKAGAAYLPIDTSYPLDRVRYLLDDARPARVITDAAFADRLPGGPPLIVSQLIEAAAPSPITPAAIRPDEAAYVVYTSGSTGRPKGVVITHAAVVNYLTWMVDEFGVRADDRMLQKTPAGFDGAVLELFWPLSCGATMVLADPGSHREPERIAELIADERITIVQFMPSMLPAFLEPELAGRCRSLRRAFSASEALPVAVMEQFSARLDAELVNLYGPTEATVDAAFFRCRPHHAGGSVPIGRPIRNLRVEVLDAELGRQSVGAVGEIYLSGIQLARGYLGRPGLTAERFVADPHGAAGERMYRTGDLGRLRPDGLIEFAGRADTQVKIGGVRVEPGEVESILSGHAAVLQAAVVAATGPSGAPRLVAYVVASSGVTATPETIRRDLRELLPDALVPALIVFVDQLPTTPNEKIDRAALARRSEQPASATAPDVPAQADSPLEQLLELARQVLGVEQARAEDNFIGVGGDSISAIQLASRARHAGLPVSTGALLRSRSFLELLQAQESVAVASTGASDQPGSFPATPIMQWLAELAPEVDGFAQSIVLRTPAGASKSEISQCLQAIIDRHDALRTAAIRLPEAPHWQLRSLPIGSVRAEQVLDTVDTTGLAGPERQAQITAGLEQARRRLRPGAPHALAAVWFHGSGTGPGRLAVVIHHLAIDGVSLRILSADLAAAWDSLRRTGRANLTPVPVSFRQWAHRLADQSVTGGRRRELDGWIAAGRPMEPELAGRRLDREVDTIGTASTCRLELSPQATDALLNRAPGLLRTNVHTVLVTGLALALADRRARTTAADGQQGFQLAFEGHGRAEVATGLDLSQTVGWFTSLYPAVIRLPADAADPDGWSAVTLRRAISSIGEQLSTIADTGTGYGQLRYLDPAGLAGLAGAPYPELLFNYLGRFAESSDEDWAIDAEHDVAMDHFDATMPLGFAVELNCFAIDRGAGLVLVAEWRWATEAVDHRVCPELAELWFGRLNRIAEQLDQLPTAATTVEARPATPSDSEFSTF